MLSLSAKVKFLLRFNGRPLALLAVGNSLRSDDGAGPYIVAHLSSSKKVLVVNAECNPENIIEEVVNFKPWRIIIIDAADFKGAPGEAKLIGGEETAQTCLSTHSIPLKDIAALLSQDSGAEVKFLGIQPKNVTIGEGLSEEVKETADLIVAQIRKEISNA